MLYLDTPSGSAPLLKDGDLDTCRTHHLPAVHCLSWLSAVGMKIWSSS